MEVQTKILDNRGGAAAGKLFSQVATGGLPVAWQSLGGREFPVLCQGHLLSKAPGSEQRQHLPPPDPGVDILITIQDN